MNKKMWKLTMEWQKWLRALVDIVSWWYSHRNDWRCRKKKVLRNDNGWKKARKVNTSWKKFQTSNVWESQKYSQTFNMTNFTTFVCSARLHIWKIRKHKHFLVQIKIPDNLAINMRDNLSKWESGRRRRNVQKCRRRR